MSAVKSNFERNIRADCTEELTAVLRERVVVIDGAMGTAIQRDRPDEAGYRGERFKDWPSDLVGNNDLLTLTQPHIIAGIHREYLEAGADILETNTFNANAISLSDYGMAELSYELNFAGAALARSACDEFSTPHQQRNFNEMHLMENGRCRQQTHPDRHRHQTTTGNAPLPLRRPFAP